MIKIDNVLLAEVTKKAAASARLRCNHNFHKSYAEKIQRLLNAANPGTYIRPHMHRNPDKIETFVLLKGKVAVFEFDDSGRVSDYLVLDAAKLNMGVEIAPGTWHTFASLEQGSVLYEVKEGPYNEQDDKKFAPWAPEEGTEESRLFLQKIIAALER